MRTKGPCVFTFSARSKGEWGGGGGDLWVYREEALDTKVSSKVPQLRYCVVAVMSLNCPSALRGGRWGALRLGRWTRLLWILYSMENLEI